FFFFSSRRRHTRFSRDWSSDVCSSDLNLNQYGIRAEAFHGGLTYRDKKNILQSWLSDENQVIVATNAFGMGIDKPNVRHVIHIQIPENIDSYYQEAGRAGRDDNDSKAI